MLHPTGPHYNTLMRMDPTDRAGTKFVGGGYWDRRVRRAPSLATPPEELAKLAGYGPDINAARAEARRLLIEAGQENLSS